jgi:hypothetical protein
MVPYAANIFFAAVSPNAQSGDRDAVWDSSHAESLSGSVADGTV